jgi:hypothetical protein
MRLNQEIGGELEENRSLDEMPDSCDVLRTERPACESGRVAGFIMWQVFFYAEKNGDKPLPPGFIHELFGAAVERWPELSPLLSK